MMDPDDKDISIKEKILLHVGKLSNPGPDDDFTETIQNLNALLISANYRQIRDVASQLDLAKLFHQFNSTSVDLFNEHLFNLLSMFLESLPPNDVLVKYFDSVLEGLYSPNVPINELWIKKIVRAVFVDDSQLKIVSKSPINIIPILKRVIRLMKSENTIISSASHDICVVASKSFRQEFFSPGIQDELKRIQELDSSDVKVADKDTVKIRFFELCVDIACTNQLLLDMVKANGYLSELTQEFEVKITQDPLVAMNMIKLMTDLASQSHGLEFLRSSTTVLPQIAKRIEQIDNDDLLGSLLLPGLINFFIRISEFDLNVLSEYKIVLAKIMQFVDHNSANKEFLVLGLDSISYICRKNTGKIFISDNQHSDKILENVAWMINHGNTELKSRVLPALNGIIEIKDADSGNVANQLTESWYFKLDSLQCGLSKFLQLAQEPFLDVRIPALNFIRILATTVWGQKVLACHPQFLDYLFDRRTETNKDGREAKFEIVRELTMSPFLRLSFSPETVLRLRDYFKVGPIENEVGVAFENS